MAVGGRLGLLWGVGAQVAGAGVDAGSLDVDAVCFDWLHLAAAVASRGPLATLTATTHTNVRRERARRESLLGVPRP